MTQRTTQTDPDWQLQHYASVGKDYGNKHFTQAESKFTNWILDQIASVNPTAQSIAEVGAGTCIFASLLGRRLNSDRPVTCFEPVAGLLEAATEFENVDATCGGAIEFAGQSLFSSYDLIFTKDTAHHFAVETLDQIHQGFRDKLAPSGRYAMVVRKPPKPDAVPVGSIAAAKWPSLYTSSNQLLESMKRVNDWREVDVTAWEKYVSTPVSDWLDGIRRRDTWSIFSALSDEEIATTIRELEGQFDGDEWFPFLHQYDVAVFERI